MTRSTIVVEIPEEMKGKTFSYKDKSNYKYETPDTTIPQDCNFTSIYVHTDGYVENGVGDYLVEECTTFKDVMEKVICGGESSCIGMPYTAARGEEWSRNKPKFHDEMPQIQEDYQYVFTKDGEWYAKAKYDSKYFDYVKISKDNDGEIETLKKTINHLKEELELALVQINNIKCK